MSSMILVSLPRWQKMSRGIVVSAVSVAPSAFPDGFADLLPLLLTTRWGTNWGISGPVEGGAPPVLHLAPEG
uniref:Uncharacterized protein n=1 Tax=Thermogemmatispora argillosa TaxID=2045280 RepID=A0A455T759_9CHLR|nr:hypothetical protein KTA_33940 [Thermogemmatispora argillosa]